MGKGGDRDNGEKSGRAERNSGKNGDGRQKKKGVSDVLRAARVLRGWVFRFLCGAWGAVRIFSCGCGGAFRGWCGNVGKNLRGMR